MCCASKYSLDKNMFVTSVLTTSRAAVVCETYSLLFIEVALVCVIVSVIVR